MVSRSNTTYLLRYADTIGCCFESGCRLGFDKGRPEDEPTEEEMKEFDEWLDKVREKRGHSADTTKTPAPAATEASANVPHSDTGTKNHANDNTLLAICQDALKYVCDHSDADNAFSRGYVAATLDIVRKMKGGAEE